MMTSGASVEGFSETVVVSGVALVVRSCCVLLATINDGGVTPGGLYHFVFTGVTI